MSRIGLLCHVSVTYLTTVTTNWQRRHFFADRGAFLSGLGSAVAAPARSCPLVPPALACCASAPSRRIHRGPQPTAEELRRDRTRVLEAIPNGPVEAHPRAMPRPSSFSSRHHVARWLRFAANVGGEAGRTAPGCNLQVVLPATMDYL